MNIEQVVAHYVATRDQIKALEAGVKEQCAPLKAQMQKIEGAIQLYLEQQGAKSIKTGAGTCYISETRKAKVLDWEAFCSHLKESGATHLLTKAVSSSAALEEIDQGHAIPGVAVNTFTTINVRRA